LRVTDLKNFTGLPCDSVLGRLHTYRNVEIDWSSERLNVYDTHESFSSQPGCGHEKKDEGQRQENCPTEPTPSGDSVWTEKRRESSGNPECSNWETRQSGELPRLRYQCTSDHRSLIYLPAVLDLPSSVLCSYNRTPHTGLFIKDTSLFLIAVEDRKSKIQRAHLVRAFLMHYNNNRRNHTGVSKRKKRERDSCINSFITHNLITS
jgi:hypothetical protein